MVVAISNDELSVVSSFAAANGIEFDLLSDRGSRVIRELGLLNEHIDRQLAVYGLERTVKYDGLPYPGVFLLDADGVVVGKNFHESPRRRPTARVLLHELVGPRADVPEGAVMARVAHPGLQLVAWFDSPVYMPYQDALVTCVVRLEPGYHTYVSPVPAGFCAFSLSFLPFEGLVEGELHIPQGRTLRIDALDHTFNVLSGTFVAALPFCIRLDRSPRRTLTLTARFQVCSDRDCLPPAEVRLKLELESWTRERR
jgi:hypothetical protein